MAFDGTLGLASLQDSRARKQESQAPTFTRTCDICGSVFTTTYPSKRRCSFECQELARNNWTNAHRRKASR